MHIRLRKTIWFLVLTFGLSWGMALFAFATFQGDMLRQIMMPLAIVYMFMPMVATLIVQKLIYKEPLKESLGISFSFNRWFVLAALLPPILALLALGVGLFIPGVEFSWDMEGMYERFASTFSAEQIAAMKVQSQSLPVHPFWLTLVQGVIAGATVNAVAGFGEELGWRGLLQKELSFLGFWRSSLVIGLIWGIWHAPLILKGHNYPTHPLEGLFYMVYFTGLYAPIFAYIRVQARSVIAVAIMHGTLNGTVPLSFMLLKGGSDLSVGMTGVAGFVVLAIANAGIWIFDKYFAKVPVIPAFRTGLI